MDFFTPDLKAGAAFKGEPASFSELVSSTYDGQKRIENYNSLWRGLEEETDARNKAIKDAGGPDLENPLRAALTYDDRRAFLGQFEKGQGDASYVQFMKLAQYEKQLEELEKQHPHLSDIINAKRPPSLVVSERMMDAEKRRQDVMERRGMVQFNFPGQALVSGPINIFRDPVAAAAMFGGSLAAQAQSPMDVAAILAGNATTGPALSLMRNAARNAISNAASQSLLEPQVQANRAAAGLEAGFSNALDNIAGAAGMGAALDIGIRAPVRAVNRARGVQGLGGTFKDFEAPAAPKPETPSGPTELPPDISPELVSRIEQGDVEAFRELITARPEIAEDPVVRGALAEVEASSYLPSKIDGVDDGQGLRTLVQMMRSEMDPQEPRPRFPDDTPEARMPLDPARAAELLADPQVAALLKAADDVQPGLGRVIEGIGEAGLPQVLDAVEDALRRAKAGEQQDAIAKAFIDATMSLANEVGPERLQALAGIHSGSASPVEMASAFKAMPDLVDSSLPASPPVDIARSLARLSDAAFDMVRRGEADPLIAQVVSDHAPETAHTGLLDDLKKAGITDPDEARRAIPDLLPPERIPDAPPLDGGSKMDDPTGKEAKEQTERLAAEYATQLAEEQAKLEARKAQAQQMQERAVLRAEQAATSQRLKDAIDEAITMSGGRIEVKTFSSLGDLPAGMAEQVLRGSMEFMRTALERYRTAADDVQKANAVRDIQRAKQGQAVEAFYHDNAIWLAEYAVNPQGRVAHEMVHALVATGQLTKAELAELAAYARRMGLFDPMREATYRATYEVSNPVSRVSEMLDEEAAAHLIEAFRNGKLPEPKADEPPAPTGILARIQAFAESLRESIMRAIGREPVKPDAEPIDSPPAIIDAILNGEVARRVVIAEQLKAEDVSALAVRPDAGVMMAMSEPLDMSPEARKARAEAMGFDTSRVWYHSTKSSFDAFKPFSHFGSSDQANMRSGTTDASLIPVYIKRGKLAKQKDTGDWSEKKLRALQSKGYDGVTYLNRYEGIPLDAFDRAIAKVGSTEKLDALSDAQFKKLVPEAQESLIVFNPSNIRSVNAAFDPRQSSSPNLMFALADRETGQSMRRDMDALEIGKPRDPNTPPIGAQREGVQSRLDPEVATATVGLSTVELVLSEVGVQFTKETSRSFSERFGPSLSTYYRVETPNGQRTIRLSDHDYISPDGGLDLRTGENASAAKVAIFNLLGRDVPAGLAEAVKADQAVIDANRKAITDARKAEAFAAENARLEPFGVAHLKGKPRREVLAAIDRAEQNAGSGYERNYMTARDALVRGMLRKYPAPRHVMFAMRDQDALGYVSQALEAARALKQAKGTPEQMLAQLKSAGVKQAEIEATGLDKFLNGELRAAGSLAEPRTISALAEEQAARKQKTITKDDIVKFLESNRVRLVEKEYAREGYSAEQAALDAGYSSVDEAASVLGYDADEFRRQHDGSIDNTKWSAYSLDPANPTYRETVIHLPEAVPTFDEYLAARIKKGTAWENPSPDNLATYRADYERGDWRNERSRDYVAVRAAQDTNFRSGHFSEPNIIGHMMTSMTRHEGKPVYTIDQIQSDWGQKLRDGGVRDEQKIAKLQAEYDQAKAAAEAAKPRLRELEQQIDAMERGGMLRKGQPATELRRQWQELNASTTGEVDRLGAELGLAQTAATGNPLVNTTDQWVNTTLRRAIRQAAEADASYIAIPHGDTVLSYNPGDGDGMRGFYGAREAKLYQPNKEYYEKALRDAEAAGDKEAIDQAKSDLATLEKSGAAREGIVPKNLRKLLEKIDKDAPKPIRVGSLETPSGTRSHKVNGEADFDPNRTGFTLFPLTDKIKQEVTQRGQVMFAFAGDTTELRERAKKAGAVLIDDIQKGAESPALVLGLHGTTAEFSTFDRSQMLDPLGPFFGPTRMADKFTKPNYARSSQGTPRTIAALISTQKVLDIEEDPSVVGTGRDTYIQPNDVVAALERAGFNPLNDASVRQAFDRTAVGRDFAAFRNAMGAERMGKEETSHHTAQRIRFDALKDYMARNGYDSIRRWSGTNLGWEYVPIVAGGVRSADTGSVMFAFAGERAKTADLEALARAKKMTADGVDRTKIWTETGWFLGVDGKWKWEIDDSGAKWARPISEWLAGGMAPRFGVGYVRAQAASATNTVNTMQMLRHPELYSAYPSIAYQPLGVIKGDGPLGMAGRTQDGKSFAAIHENAQPMPAKGALMHEVAGHGVQHQEGFAAGGNKSMFSVDEIATEQQRMGSAATDDGWSSIGTAAPDDPVSAAQRLYMRLAGEVEARAVQKRMDMTPEERSARPPWMDYDVPEDQQIVRFADGSGVSQLSYSSEPPVEGFPTIKGNIMFAIRAFHGSPHDFDRFDMSKIGTGEGAQAYGHGLYFAEEEAVAKAYRDVLGNYSDVVKWKGSQPPTAEQQAIINQLSGFDAQRGRAPDLASIRTDLTRARNQIYMSEGMPGRDPERSARDIARLTEQISVVDGMKDLIEIKPPGRLYEVRINASPDDFLDWDKPYSSNPKAVAFAQQVGIKPHADTGAAFTGAVDSKFAGYPATAEGRERAVKALREAGIPGIKYLDQDSRTAGEGSRNYVVFDDSLIEIVAKDGKPIEKAERQSVIDGMMGKKEADGSGPMFAFADPPVTPGLDMSPEARKARAEQMGFDTSRVWYHGTKYTFDAFEVSSDRTKTGSGEYGRADQGVFLTPDRNFAREYGKNVGSYYVRDPKPYIFQRSSELNANDKARAQQELQFAKDNGFSSFHDIREFAPEIIVFDPKNIRSINAAFDPANADSPNLMFAMADNAQPEQPNEVQRLTSRLRKLAPAASQIDPAFPERVQAGLDLLTTMREVQSESIDHDAAPNVVSLAQENASRTLMQMMEVLGPERTEKVQADVQTLLKDLPNDPQELAARINAILDQYFPEEPKKAANDNMDLGPMSPVEQEMFNIERIGAIMELIGVCRG